MIRKFLVWLFVCFIWFISFSYWYSIAEDMVVRNIWSYAYSPDDNNFDISFQRYWNPLTSNIWSLKPVFYLKNWTYFLWKYSDYLWWIYPFISVFDNKSNRYFQWFPLKYALCNSFIETSLSYDLTWCTVEDLTSDSYSLIQSFMNSINSNDFYSFKYNIDSFQDTRLNDFWLNVCFSSSQFSKSLCFGIWESKYSCDVIYPWYSVCRDWPLSYSWYGITMPLSFNALDRDNFDMSPWQGWNVDWSSSITQNVSVTWNLVYNTCTNWYIINKLEYIYWSSYRHTCYAWTTDTWSVTSDYQFSNILPWNWLNIIELYNLTSNWQSRNDWFTENTYAIQKFREWRLNANPFLGSPIALYSYFDILYDDALIPSLCVWDSPSCPYTILNYCKLVLYSDYNSPYEYWYFWSYCSDLNNWNWDVNISTWDVWSVDWTWELLPPWYNQNNNWSSSWSAVAVDWSWILSGDTNRNFDWKTFINDVYQKFQSKLIKPYYGATIWIVPNFILVFLFALILFRFLQH